MAHNVKCNNCGKNFSITPSRFKKRNVFYCSKECEANYRRSEPNTVCYCCGNKFHLKNYRIKRLINKKPCCSKECSNKLKEEIYSGRNNPNCKYDVKDDFFKSIDSSNKAYILGLIASDGHIKKSGIVISLHSKDRHILESISKMVCDIRPIEVKNRLRLNGIMSCLAINSGQMAQDACRHLKIGFGKKSDIVKFPDLDKQFVWDFIRGFFDGDGDISNLRNRGRYPKCSITSNSTKMLRSIKNICGIPSSITTKGDRLYFNGNSALDFMGKMYDGAELYLSRKRDLYCDWSYWVPSLSGNGKYGRELLFKWNKARKDAVVPFKSRASDSGYDLVILDKVKQFGKVELWDTGIKIKPEYGWYFDLVPRSSIIKSGYILANMIGVIDRTYIGNIMVPLMKIDPDAEPLKGGERLVQIIPRPIVNTRLVLVDEIEETERGEGGFGSSGK